MLGQSSIGQPCEECSQDCRLESHWLLPSLAICFKSWLQVKSPEDYPWGRARRYVQQWCAELRCSWLLKVVFADVPIAPKSFQTFQRHSCYDGSWAWCLWPKSWSLVFAFFAASQNPSAGRTRSLSCRASFASRSSYLYLFLAKAY